MLRLDVGIPTLRIGRRDGWPAFFPFSQARTDTIAAGSELLTQHRAQRIYWHIDMGRDTSSTLGNWSIEELARGRASIEDAPAEEIVIAPWFGPAAALAGIAGGVARLIDQPIRLTAVSGLTGLPRLRDLRPTAVERSALLLPVDFKQRPWPGFPPTPAMISRDEGAHWRTLSLPE
jgi:hypothetical protein